MKSAARIAFVTVVALGAAALITLYLRSGGPDGGPATGPYPPVQAMDSRGVDVQAAQYLLNQHGRHAPVSGVFDRATRDAVRDFQSDTEGLRADGVVGPATWARLVVTLKEGARGDAVRALQSQLNAKRRTALPAGGIFDRATTAAVRDFQRRGGLPDDGVAGRETWILLLAHLAYVPFDGSMCDQDPDGNGLANWGTGAAVAQLSAAAHEVAARGRGPLPVGDLSFESGGDIPGHGSHEVGLDADVWPIRTDMKQCEAGRITWRSATYDRAATRELVRSLRAAAPGHVRYIWFNDPELIKEGLVEALVEHDNHLHVRYCEADHRDERYRCP